MNDDEMLAFGQNGKHAKSTSRHRNKTEIS
jgi:hypothetical protein